MIQEIALPVISTQGGNQSSSSNDSTINFSSLMQSVGKVPEKGFKGSTGWGKKTQGKNSSTKFANDGNSLYAPKATAFSLAMTGFPGRTAVPNTMRGKVQSSNTSADSKASEAITLDSSRSAAVTANWIRAKAAAPEENVSVSTQLLPQTETTAQPPVINVAEKEAQSASEAVIAQVKQEGTDVSAAGRTEIPPVIENTVMTEKTVKNSTVTHSDAAPSFISKEVLKNASADTDGAPQMKANVSDASGFAEASNRNQTEMVFPASTSSNQAIRQPENSSHPVLNQTMTQVTANSSQVNEKVPDQKPFLSVMIEQNTKTETPNANPIVANSWITQDSLQAEILPDKKSAGLNTTKVTIPQQTKADTPAETMTFQSDIPQPTIPVQIGNATLPFQQSIQLPIQQVVSHAVVSQPTAVTETIMDQDAKQNPTSKTDGNIGSSAKPVNLSEAAKTSSMADLLSDKPISSISIPVVKQDGNIPGQILEQPLAASSQTLSKNDSGNSAAETAKTGEIPKAADAEHKEEKTDTTDKTGSLPASYSLNDKRMIVSVSDASSQIKKPILHQVTDQVLMNYHQNKKEFQMELYPENLGKVSVKLSMQNNVLTVAISSENSKTQSLLLSHAGHIQSVLQDSMNQNVQVIDSQPKQWYQQNQDNPHQSQQQDQEQQKQNRTVYNDSQDNENGEDFLTLMQRLRLQTVSV